MLRGDGEGRGGGAFFEGFNLDARGEGCRAGGSSDRGRAALRRAGCSAEEAEEEEAQTEARRGGREGGPRGRERHGGRLLGGRGGETHCGFSCDCCGRHGGRDPGGPCFRLPRGHRRDGVHGTVVILQGAPHLCEQRAEILHGDGQGYRVRTAAWQDMWVKLSDVRKSIFATLDMSDGGREARRAATQAAVECELAERETTPATGRGGIPHSVQKPLPQGGKR